MKASTVIENIKRMQQALLVVGALNLTVNNFNKETNVQDGAKYDFIIVGAGSAGSIVASRLSEIENVTILLIEAGGDPPLESELPGLIPFLISSAYDWNYTTTNDGYSSQCLPENRLRYIRGKMLGGSSSINWLAYNRGNPYDYHKFAEAVQDPSWKWENILPYFKKIENLTDKRLLHSPYRAFHGTNGNVKLKRSYSDSLKELFESVREIGENVLLDLTADEFLGFTEPLFNLGNGMRQSTANCYLEPAINRKNLEILKNAFVTKIIFDDSLQATGVEVIDKNNEKIVVTANKEVILSAGSIGSPQLLMLSGIGPKHHLRRKNIPVLMDLPVGQEMQDHVSNLMIFKMEKSSNDIQPINVREVTPPLAMGFIALNKSQIQPDFQIVAQSADYKNFLASCAVMFGWEKHNCDNIYKEIEGHRIIILTTHLFYERSRGKILLQSKDPRQHPIINTGYYSNIEDLDNHVKYVQYILKLNDTDFFRRVDAKLINPKLKQCIDFEFNSREYWECYILCSATPEFHMTSTCPMGSVVDSRLKVYGVKNLRVVDASVMPLVPGANTNGPTMMIGEKASDMIKEDHKLC